MSFRGIAVGVLVVGALAAGGLYMSGAIEEADGAESATANLLAQVEGQPESIVIEMAESYTPNASYADDYRCFLFDPQLEEETSVTGFRVIPGQENLVHHVVLFVAPVSLVPQAEGSDRADPGPGWECFGGPGTGGSGDISASLGTWAPGLDNSIFPEGTAKMLRPGTQLVMQVHYSLAGTGEIAADNSAVELIVSENEGLEPLLGFTIAAPVEIKCAGEYPSDSTDRCHRDYAISQVEDPTTNGLMHSQCRTSPGMYLARDVGDGSAQSVTCTLRIPRPANVLGAFGHMHLRGTTLTVEVNPDTDDEQLLLHIPRWNFNNQEMHWFDQPIEVPGGSNLRITCTYDNSSAIPAPDGSLYEPRYIIWGEGTTDEMCLALLQYVNL